MMINNKSPQIYTVSRLNAEVRLLLENEMGVVWLLGEISNLAIPGSGHWYFTLKDQQAQVKCAMFKGNNRHVTFRPVQGQSVLVRARLSLYEPRGDYQLIAESMQPEGDGLLQQAFETLKLKLSQEGLFSTALKKPIPHFPKSIGLITSKTGAALHDVLQVLKRRNPLLKVIIYPTLVQGKEATKQIVQSLVIADARQECDVLILGRGGGSLEDLWCFNEEAVARQIAACTIPIVSAVGHETDVTIADFVADVRAPTPSAAAEIVSPDTRLLQQSLAEKTRKLAQHIQDYFASQHQALTTYRHRLAMQDPKYQLHQKGQRIDELERRLKQGIFQILQTRKHGLNQAFTDLKHQSPQQIISSYQATLTTLRQQLNEEAKNKILKNQHLLALYFEKLDAVSPLSTFSRGYSLTQGESGKNITSIQEVKEGQIILTKLIDGEILSKVIQSAPKD